MAGTRVTSSFSPFRRRNSSDGTKIGPVSWPGIWWALIRDRASFCRLPKCKMRVGGEEDVPAARSWVVVEPFHAPLLIRIINSMQMFLRGVGLFVDLLDVASVSQGLMLNRYLRLE